MNLMQEACDMKWNADLVKLVLLRFKLLMWRYCAAELGPGCGELRSRGALWNWVQKCKKIIKMYLYFLFPIYYCMQM
jgi:hypothetical protein